MARIINTLTFYVSFVMFAVVTLSRMRFDGLSLLLIIIVAATFFIDRKADRALNNN